MDFDLLKKDGVALVKDLPKDFVEDLARLLTRHDMGSLFPKMMVLVPHIRTLAFEAMAGGVDEAEMEKTIKEIVRSVGIELPEAPGTAA